MESFISLENIKPRIPDLLFPSNLSWKINRNEIWTITGRNGSGKSLLAEVITGKYALQQGKIHYHFVEKLQLQKDGKFLLPRDLIKTVNFDGAYSLNGFREIYYQQRFNSTESEEIPYVYELFVKNKDNEITELLNLKRIWNRRLNHLSSGELRRLLIARALAGKPHMLILDNPYIGLDIASREQLNDIFIRLFNNGIQLVFIVPSEKDIPLCTTHILRLNNFHISFQGNISDFESHKELIEEGIPAEIDWNKLPENTITTTYRNVIQMTDIDIAYGNVMINSGINWTVERNAKWALLGPNGSGKSTLLSYVFADNPQAYAKKLWLFDRKRGSGESIWDIKKTDRFYFIGNALALQEKHQFAGCSSFRLFLIA